MTSILIRKLTEEENWSQPWVGVDLDGTLATDLGQPGGAFAPIGPPIVLMLARVQEFLATGQIVKIFTARASTPGSIPLIQDYLETIGLPRLEVTNVKDPAMVELYDDRARQVVKNDGSVVGELLI